MIDLNALLGLSLTQLSLKHMLARAFFAYVFGIVVILLNRRFIVALSPVDIVVKLMIGTALAGAIVGVSPYFETLAMVAFLVFLNWLLSLLSFYNSFINRFFSGKKEILFKDSHIIKSALRSNFITEEALMHAVRKRGLKTLDQVEVIFVESNGEISVIPK